MTILRFTEVRGQPTRVRFRKGEDAWGPWQPFGARVEAALPERPTEFQLKSRLGVTSPPCAVGR